ncbi:hypothetical protein RhiXN_11654 [Rhizoctonia solani]|uniref:Uncharacterized protein n=1 Tax=Rhizoctonia solani TaxID=456999 RepID=A0A8H8P5L8_9AGAM|nr:uncharacterized protein RhiXN_11654 [Rhizoctonia solani]QRW24742.1 hypothetical protein RhiXN_11654 [Rhizoctonia solani]
MSMSMKWAFAAERGGLTVPPIHVHNIAERFITDSGHQSHITPLVEESSPPEKRVKADLTAHGVNRIAPAAGMGYVAAACSSGRGLVAYGHV